VKYKSPDNGGTILQINSQEAATWLKQEGVMKEFVNNIGGMSIFKAQQLHTVVEFVPIAFELEAEGALRMVEMASGLTAGSITSAQYFKLVHC
jgi:hypothetical protein